MQVIGSRIHPSVETRLINSGHYSIGQDNRVTSVHLSQLRLARGYLAYPPLIAGQAEDIVLGRDHGKGYLRGLENLVRIQEPGHPAVYVIDNHQNAYFAWLESLALGEINEGAELVHIDLHQDSLQPFHWPLESDLASAANYLVETLRVEDFILPLVIKGTISKFWNFCVGPCDAPVNRESEGRLEWSTEQALLKLKDYPASFNRRIDNNVVPFCMLPNITIGDLIERRMIDPKYSLLDIDLDAFILSKYKPGRIPSEDSFNECCSFIADIARHFGVITIATSPGFADQETAVMLARKMVREIMARH